jgi:hypothetical protein
MAYTEHSLIILSHIVLAFETNILIAVDFPCKLIIVVLNRVT